VGSNPARAEDALNAAVATAEASGDWPAARRYAERLYAFAPNLGRLDLALAMLRTAALPGRADGCLAPNAVR
jgi:hypothetical protein